MYKIIIMRERERERERENLLFVRTFERFTYLSERRIYFLFGLSTPPYFCHSHNILDKNYLQIQILSQQDMLTLLFCRQKPNSSCQVKISQQVLFSRQDICAEKNTACMSIEVLQIGIRRRL